MSKPLEKKNITVAELKKILGDKAKGLRLKDDLYDKYLEGFEVKPKDKKKKEKESPKSPKGEAKKPKNVVCEGGVCRIVKSPKKESPRTKEDKFKLALIELTNELAKTSGEPSHKILVAINTSTRISSMLLSSLANADIGLAEKTINLGKYITPEVCEDIAMLYSATSRVDKKKLQKLYQILKENE